MLDFVEYKASLDVHAAQNIEKREKLRETSPPNC